MNQVAIKLALISGFRSMKRLGVFLLPPKKDASPPQGYPQALNSLGALGRGSMRVICLAQ